MLVLQRVGVLPESNMLVRKVARKPFGIDLRPFEKSLVDYIGCEPCRIA